MHETNERAKKVGRRLGTRAPKARRKGSNEKKTGVKGSGQVAPREQSAASSRHSPGGTTYATTYEPMALPECRWRVETSQRLVKW